MRVFLIVAWLAVGLSGLIFHFGPGRTLEKNDEVNALLTKARYNIDQQQWSQAVKDYDAALDFVPETEKETQFKLKLEKAKAQMMAAQLPDARLGLETLLDEVQAEFPADAKLVRETRMALASTQYYVTWLMRLEGLGREEWEPEIEAARQNYRLLAEQADADGNSAEIEQRREDLEAAVRLARMDLSDLQALPLPSQCCNCDSGKCRNKGKKPGKRPAKKDGEGTGFQPPPDGSGS